MVLSLSSYHLAANLPTLTQGPLAQSSNIHLEPFWISLSWVLIQARLSGNSARSAEPSPRPFHQTNLPPCLLPGSQSSRRCLVRSRSTSLVVLNPLFHPPFFGHNKQTLSNSGPETYLSTSHLCQPQLYIAPWLRHIQPHANLSSQQ